MPKHRTVFTVTPDVLAGVLRRDAVVPADTPVAWFPEDVFVLTVTENIGDITVEAVIEYTKKEVDDLLIKQFSKLLAGTNGNSINVHHNADDSVTITYSGKVDVRKRHGIHTQQQLQQPTIEPTIGEPVIAELVAATAVPGDED